MSISDHDFNEELDAVVETTITLLRENEQDDYSPVAFLATGGDVDVMGLDDGEGLTVLREVRETLSGVADWTTPALEAAVKQYCDAKGLGLGKVAQPLRVAISGTTVSPPIFESLEFLGRERVTARIGRCLTAAAG